MGLAALFSLVTVWIAAIVAPGPDTVQLIRLGSRSRRNAVAAAIGICTGNIIWPVLSMIGLAALIAAFPWILSILYIGGGLFLLYMGVGAIRSGFQGRQDSTTISQQAFANTVKPLTDLAAWRLGLATNLSNPKALIFFGAIFAQFLPVDATITDRITVLILMTTIGLIWFCGFAWFVSLPVWAEKLQRANPIIEVIAGVVFILISTFLLFEGVWRLVC